MKNWIWLDSALYPDAQTGRESVMADEMPGTSFCAAAFRKTYHFDRTIAEVSFRISADTQYQLTLNGQFLGAGPAAPGGDFLCKSHVLPHYADMYTLHAPDVGGDTLQFSILVQHTPLVLTDYSRGHGGLFVEGTVVFTDGTETVFTTDESWMTRVDRRRLSPTETDAGQEEDAWSRARFTKDRWQTEDSPLPPLDVHPVYAEQNPVFVLRPGETRTELLRFDRIYAAYTALDARGCCDVSVCVTELPGRSGPVEIFHTAGQDTYRSLLFHSTGVMTVTMTNTGTDEASVRVYAIARAYPVEKEKAGSFACSDAGLCAVYDVCTWTLQICRQQMHLDSVTHQELLACTGDYYIESLMTAATFGDMTLAELDIKRTAAWLVQNDGRMFHTTYSLIWVLLLRDVYRITGHRKLLTDSVHALSVLLDRFAGYLGTNGLVEKAPDYMFVDWAEADGYSLHHPPKYLGQTVLTAFYAGALEAAGEIYTELGDTGRAEELHLLRERVKQAFNTLLYDPERGLYIEGLGTPDDPDAEHTPGYFTENKNVRHFACYGNILACLFGLCEGERAERVMRTVAEDASLSDIQPYFMHWELEALWKTGLFAAYGMEKLGRWKALAAECPRGLKEGWFAPPDYAFDYSHAWGGTPAYQLPVRLLGLEIVEPGFRKITLQPRLFGLAWAEIAVPTPFGQIRCRMEEGKETVLSVPDAIVWELR